jgi:3-phenylpropionate/cinnamic acid dioxygenase small subunit
MNAVSGAAPVDLETLRSIEEFLIHECDLLDRRKFEEWNALYAPDAVYWVPSQPDQEDALNTVSIFYDDAHGRDVRIRRLRHPRNLVEEEAPTRTLRTVQNVRARRIAAAEYEAASQLLVLEYRGGTQRIWGARCTHRLHGSGAGFRIAFKRVDLLNCDAVLPMMSVPF